MRTLVFLAVVVSASAAPTFVEPYSGSVVAAPAIPAPAVPQQFPVEYISRHHAQDELGQVNYGFSHTGQAKNEVRDAYGNVAGVYTYIDANNEPIRVEYTAGVNGFQVRSNNLPEAQVPPDPVLPVAPEPIMDTPEVTAAKLEFVEAYNKAALAAAAAPDEEDNVFKIPAEGVVEVVTELGSLFEAEDVSGTAAVEASVSEVVGDTKAVEVVNVEEVVLSEPDKDVEVSGDSVPLEPLGVVMTVDEKPAAEIAEVVEAAVEVTTQAAEVIEAAIEVTTQATEVTEAAVEATTQAAEVLEAAVEVANQAAETAETAVEVTTLGTADVKETVDENVHLGISEAIEDNTVIAYAKFEDTKAAEETVSEGEETNIEEGEPHEDLTQTLSAKENAESTTAEGVPNLNVIPDSAVDAKDVVAAKEDFYSLFIASFADPEEVLPQTASLTPTVDTEEVAKAKADFQMAYDAAAAAAEAAPDYDLDGSLSRYSGYLSAVDGALSPLYSNYPPFWTYGIHNPILPPATPLAVLGTHPNPYEVPYEYFQSPYHLYAQHGFYNYAPHFPLYTSPRINLYE